MDEAHIPRRKADDSDLGFEQLRSEAIALIEQVSGKVWTDYNLHDPGITILEQLIYAITDLSYRCDFAIQDYLADSAGELDLQAQALHRPAEIFTCRPTTSADYRKLLLDVLPQIDNLWLSETSHNGIRGLYQLSVKLKRGLAPGEQEAVVARIREIYRGARNLCEDLGGIAVVENREYELFAEIEISSAQDPAEILAKVYFDCARRIASGVKITTYDQIDPDNRSLENLFDGPLTRRGFFQDDDDGQQKTGFPVSALFEIVNRIDGVDQIEQLFLVRLGTKIYDRIPSLDDDAALDLAVPQNQDQIKVRLNRNGRELRVAFTDFKARFEEISSKYYASRRSPLKLPMLYRPIEVQARPLQRYFSIQNHLPSAYGVNRFGVPKSASPEVKGRVRQLKAYLALFEQFLVNFLANMDALDVLFSARTETRASYATAVLDSQQVHDLEAVYPADAARVFSEIVARFDNFNERKSRLLDYLLALYGERFNQYSLRHFNYYYSRDEVDGVIVDNKVRFLRDIVELGRDRGAAPDYQSASAPAISGLARRAALLLGFTQPLWLTAAIEAVGVELCSHEDFRRRIDVEHGMELVDTADLDADRYSQPARIPVASEWSASRLRDELGGIAALGSGLLSETLLRHGIAIERYRVGRDSDGENYRLYFRLDDAQSWRLGEFSDRDAAVHAANYLRRFLLLLNRDSEGLHIVEHLMLRPRQAPANAEAADFYSFRISAVLPAWTRRCSDPHFRNLARETLRLNAPAHVFVEFYWLEFERMNEFERLYRAWLECQRDTDASAQDRSARAVIDFLLQAPASQDEQYWRAS